MKPKRYIVWSKKDVDLDDPWLMDGGGTEPPERVRFGLELTSRSSGFFFDRASTNVYGFAAFGALFLLFLSAVPRFLPCPVPGAFLDTSFPMCRESTVLAIRNGPFSTGCFFIISSGSSQNTRAGSSGTMVSSGRSSRMSSSVISTAATPNADLLGSGARAAGPNIF